ncbi:MAG: 4-hydroxy-3-methylbut-2-en-yl diphosphate synthase [Clostridia bacterium]|jgi:(E)-4-hydroxy-3-methylbut-2-enyl-diphosphate synthase|nr:4-hydroxy-3-methylbut-2-en-yl diphosphate synthase [Clostridia bacterium]
MRRKTKGIRIGSIYIGNGMPIAIQSMTNTHTQDVKATVNQIKALEEAGCQIIRVAVPDMEAAAAITQIKKNINIPLVADIHFDYKLAIESIKNGVDKIRINPGNIGDIDRIRMVVDTAREYEIPIRVGVNSGSVERELLAKYGGPTADALVESAINKVRLLEDMNYDNMVISIKSSDVMLSIDSYRKISELTDYPLHLGVTEAGTKYTGTVKSAVGLGTLLYMGIGDTIRVSLTGDPVDEIAAAKEILKSLKLIEGGVEIISCPTCGRTNVNLIEVATELEKAVKDMATKRPIKVAVMGCAVNGPGEAREADVGIAGGKGEFLLFVKGEIVKKIPQENAINELVNFLKQMEE